MLSYTARLTLNNCSIHFIGKYSLRFLLSVPLVKSYDTGRLRMNEPFTVFTSATGYRFCYDGFNRAEKNC